METKIFKLLNYRFSGKITHTSFDGVYVKYDGENAVFGYTTKPQHARCCFLLAMHAENGPFELTQKPRFDTVGPMLDMSRGKVMTVAAVKEYIDYIAALGMNMLMLYTEDMFEVEGYPKFGHLRGRYTIAELREIDDYGYEMGVELIPCIQTFGHLEQYIKMKDANVPNENATVLLPGHPDTYAFIDAELTAIRKAFRTDRIHLGMDETHGLGLGKYLKEHGLRNPGDIYREHLAKVLEISSKYFKKPIIWSDMFFEGHDGRQYGLDVVDQAVIDNTPRNVNLCFWNYYRDYFEWYDDQLTQHDRFPNEISFGGGIWTWDGLAPNLTYTLNTMEPAMRACLAHNVKTIIATLWVSGTNGADYHQALPGLTIFSEMCYLGEACTREDIYRASETLCGVDEALFNAISDIYLGYNGAVSLAKGFVYCDLLIDLMCYDVDYTAALETMNKAYAVIDAHKDYAHREFFLSLYRIAILRIQLLKGLRPAYKAGDKDFLQKAASQLIPALISEFDTFYPQFLSLWRKYYKGFGLEMYTHDFGGNILRLKDVKALLESYLSGEIDAIEELETETISGINKTWRSSASYMSRMRY